MQTLSLSITNFNNKVKTMNQTNSRQLMLTAEEARNLHADIFALLVNIAEMQAQFSPTPASPASSLNLDAGGFL